MQVTRSDNENIKALGRESDLLTLVFEPELVLLIPHLEGTITYLQRESETYERSLKMRQMVAASLEQLALPEITTHFARLHVLPPNFGYGLSRLKGGLSALQVAARVWKEGGDESEAKEFGKMIVQACQTLLRNAEELVDIARARRIAVMAE
ncbi:hypothetical protein [Xanthomonas campestris]|uniref:hypothetical protein n=1 Tax=Xanthomonas campestris TaxID=339 RepID=UPI00129078E6|nr:hypothetical protein [Xanthomonas campestris]